MLTPFVSLRGPTASDVNYVLDVDVKCFDDPWTIENWREVFGDQQKFKLMATYFGSPIGFAVWERTHDSMNVIRLAVKPTYRRSGTGSQLLKAIEASAYNLQLFKVTFPVTESLCCPGDPRDVSQWLIKRGARAGSIVKNGGFYMGKEEDAFLFNLLVKGAA